MYLFTNDDYYSATYSEAEWHKNAGEYGKNYDPDLHDLVMLLQKKR